MPASVRRRPAAGTGFHFEADNLKSDGYDSADPASAAVDFRHLRSVRTVDGVSTWLLIFSFFAAVLLYVHTVSNTLPPAVTVDNAAAGQFVEERARKTLNELTAFGPRPVGSKANEELTVDYLITELTQIRSQMNVNMHSLDIDVQRVSGTFTIDFFGPFTSIYENVNNVVAKLCPKHGSNDSLLVNCHYDTVFKSAGM